MEKELAEQFIEMNNLKISAFFGMASESNVFRINGMPVAKTELFFKIYDWIGKEETTTAEINNIIWIITKTAEISSK